MQGRLYKNIHNRITFKNWETQKKVYKVLIHNKDNVMHETLLPKLNKQQFAHPARASSSYIRNLCFLTTRARSTYRDFRLNRNMIKTCASKKLLQGIKRSSW